MRRQTLVSPIGIAVAGLSAAFVTSSALAGFTAIGPPAAGEANHAQILAQIYGGSFSASGVDFNGSGASAGITAVRVHDFDSGGGHTAMLNMSSPNLGSANDQIWRDGLANADVEVKYAGDNHQMGWYDNTTATHNNLFGTNPNLPGDEVNGVSFSTSFEWTLSTDFGNNISSDETNGSPGFADNAANGGTGDDMMVTYQITGLGNAFPTWLVFWEDRLSGQLNDDFDFNDLVVEIQLVPLPAPAALAGLGLVGGVIGRRRLRRKLAE